MLSAWTDYWSAWARVRASADLDRAPLDEVADAAVVTAAISLFEQERQTGRRPAQTEVVTHPTITGVSTSQATIEDCVLLTPSFTDATGVWYQAELHNDGAGWIVAELRIPRLQGCVPSAIADAAIATFEGFYDGWPEFWDPADPDHPLVAELLASPQLELTKNTLRDHQERGAALRGRPATHPEVIEVRSPLELVILDCYEPNASYGLFDIASGARLEDVPPVVPGQRNLRSAVMLFVDGKWKISDFQGLTGRQCEHAPTERGLPSV